MRPVLWRVEAEDELKKYSRYCSVNQALTPLLSFHPFFVSPFSALMLPPPSSLSISPCHQFSSLPTSQCQLISPSFHPPLSFLPSSQLNYLLPFPLLHTHSSFLHHHGTLLLSEHVLQWRSSERNLLQRVWIHPNSIPTSAMQTSRCAKALEV